MEIKQVGKKKAIVRPIREVKIGKAVRYDVYQTALLRKILISRRRAKSYFVNARSEKNVISPI